MVDFRALFRITYREWSLEIRVIRMRICKLVNCFPTAGVFVHVIRSACKIVKARLT